MLDFLHEYLSPEFLQANWHFLAVLVLVGVAGVSYWVYKNYYVGAGVGAGSGDTLASTHPFEDLNMTCDMDGNCEQQEGEELNDGEATNN